MNEDLERLQNNIDKLRKMDKMKLAFEMERLYNMLKMYMDLDEDVYGRR